MPTPFWFPRAAAVHAAFLSRAQGKGTLRTPDEVARFFALAIAGEAGELANYIKKEWRGDQVDPTDIAHEMADIRICLEHLAQLLNIDLDGACASKLEIVAQRLKKEMAHD